jgi:hypothetical protein
MPRPDDDEVPIRRHTKRPAPLWKHPAVWIGLGTLTLVFMVVVSLAVARVSSHADGRRLMQSSKWWTKGATPAKVQAIVNELCSYGGLTIYFNSDADFTRSMYYKPSKKIFLPHSTHFQRLRLALELDADSFTRPSVIVSGDYMQLRVVQSPEGGRLTTEQAVMMIEDELQQPPVNGSGEGFR